MNNPAEELSELMDANDALAERVGARLVDELRMDETDDAERISAFQQGRVSTASGRKTNIGLARLVARIIAEEIE